MDFGPKLGGKLGPSWLCWSMLGHLGSNLMVLETMWMVMLEDAEKTTGFPQILRRARILRTGVLGG